ncbi:hypothetical protein R1sor_000024 [Riccia sorocarpa]|uniref:Uncharacterized protein n=1 Tax=Riccia sorocarpa TaxID=122646 RepID=A0ABD3GU86_9MARC
MANTEVLGLDSPLSALLLADDVALIERSETRLRQALQHFSDWATLWGLDIGHSKCGVLPFSDPFGPFRPFLAQDRSIPLVTDYKYLGVTFTRDITQIFTTWLQERAAKGHQLLKRRRFALGNSQLTLADHILMFKVPTDGDRRFSTAGTPPSAKGEKDGLGTGSRFFRDLRSDQCPSDNRFKDPHGPPVPPTRQFSTIEDRREEDNLKHKYAIGQCNTEVFIVRNEGNGSVLRKEGRKGPKGAPKGRTPHLECPMSKPHKVAQSLKCCSACRSRVSECSISATSSAKSSAERGESNPGTSVFALKPPLQRSSNATFKVSMDGRTCTAGFHTQ